MSREPRKSYYCNRCQCAVAMADRARHQKADLELANLEWASQQALDELTQLAQNMGMYDDKPEDN